MARYRRFLQPRLLVRRTDGALAKVGGGDGWPTVLIPRAETSFERARLFSGDWKGRRAAEKRAAASSPYARPGVRVERDPAGLDAGLWIWDASRFEPPEDRLIAPAVMPESLAFAPLRQGVRVVTCIQGYEGQAFQDDALVASRYWPDPPTDEEWTRFLRHARVELNAAAQAAQAPISAPFKDGFRPLDLDPHNLQAIFAPGRLAALVVLAVCLSAAFQGMRVVGETALAASLSARATAFTKENREAMAARRDALVAAGAVGEIRARADYDSPARILQLMLGETPVDTAALDEFTFSDGRLEVYLTQKGNIDHASLIGRLEKSKALENVTVEVIGDNNSFIIRADTPTILGGDAS
ncbi:MAG: hypothetical protein AAGC56_03655 [Pseudomonadota bacterium]